MKLTLSNFQIHKQPTTLEIPEGETTYVEGDSDIGKSSRLRGMRWVGENKPDGGSFVTFKQPRGTNARVMLETDGRVVIRERGKSTNLYKMDGETFEAFGRSVPEPIAKFLNLSPYAFQLQGEPPFLIGASPTDAAKILSEACGLGVIDTATAFVKGKKTVADAEIRKSEILLESAQQRLSTATEQLPLADALEAAARVGDDVEELSSNVELLSDAIGDEPEGEVIDAAAARQIAAAAHACEVERGVLTTMMMSLCGLIRAEPQGEITDVSAVSAAAAQGWAITAEIDLLHEGGVKLSRAIGSEPTGAVLDVATAKGCATEARIIADWMEAVSESAERVRRAMQNEPQGELRDVSAVSDARDHIRNLADECGVLEKMGHAMRMSLKAEPRESLMDTTELLNQRAQIKVCSQCGREL